MRAPLKALKTELSIETSPALLAIFVCKWDWNYWTTFEIRKISRFWLSQKWPRQPKKYPIFQKCDFTTRSISNRASQPYIYRSFGWSPKNRCFWPSGPENHGFWPISALFGLNAPVWPLLKMKRVCPPPQKVASKIFFPDVPDVPKPLNRRNNDLPLGRTDLIFEITRVYP